VFFKPSGNPVAVDEERDRPERRADERRAVAVAAPGTQLVQSLGCTLRACDGSTHQNVLLTWLSSTGSTLSEALRRLLEEHG
jgi:hypothetical protein